MLSRRRSASACCSTAYTISTALLHAQTRISDRTRGDRARAHGDGADHPAAALAGLPRPGAAGDRLRRREPLTFYADLANTTFVPEQARPAVRERTLTQRDYPGSSDRTPPSYTFAAAPVAHARDPDSCSTQPLASVPFFTYYSFDAGDPVAAREPAAGPAQRRRRGARGADPRLASRRCPRGGSRTSSTGEPFTADVYIRTADPSDPDHSPLCI